MKLKSQQVERAAGGKYHTVNTIDKLTKEWTYFMSCYVEFLMSSKVDYSQRFVRAPRTFFGINWLKMMKSKTRSDVRKIEPAGNEACIIRINTVLDFRYKPRVRPDYGSNERPSTWRSKNAPIFAHNTEYNLCWQIAESFYFLTDSLTKGKNRVRSQQS